MTTLADDVLISADAIHRRVDELAAAIAADHAGSTPHLLCVLKGAFIFAADLVRALPLPATVDFVAVTSYGNDTDSSGDVQLLKDLDEDIAGRSVVIVDDIVDTGLTMARLRGLLLPRRPASLRIAALLSKPARRRIEIPLDYVGFEIPDRFVFGYGLDHAGAHRQLPHVVALPAHHAPFTGS